MSKLGDFVRVQGGYAFKSSELSDDKTGVPVIKIGNITGGSFVDLSNYQSVSFQLFEKTKSFATKDNDILIAMTGANVGKTSRVPVNSDAYLINQRVGRFLLKEDCPYTSDFIYYVVSSKQAYQYFSRVADGAAQPNISGKTIEDLEFPNIDSRCANKIGNILKSLDDKIQLNTQINQTLEQIAQTIFKSWFIDFDPVHAKANALASGQTAEQATQAAMAVISGKNTQELHRLQTANPEQYQQLWEIAEAFPGGFDEEGVPRGWGYEKSENLFDVGIGKTPPRKEPEWFSENSNDIEWISIKDMGNSEVFVNKSSEYLLESAVNKFNVKRIPENTVILSFKLTVGRVGITTKETTTNEAIAHFRLCEKSYLTTEFLYLYLKNFDFNNLGSTSSIATAVNSKTIKEMEILYPTLEIINVFQYRVSDIFKAIRVNSEQSNCLEKIRNELLPKLLSGELNGLPEKAI